MAAHNLSKLKIIQLNCHSIVCNSKKSQLKLFILKHNPDILLLSETFLKPKHNLHINGYNIYRTDRIDNNGGGTAVLIKSCIKHQIVNPPQTESIESTIIKIICNKKTYIIASVYAPKQNINEQDLKKLLNLGNQVVVAGDFNGKHKSWKCNLNNKNGTIIYNFIAKRCGTVTMYHADEFTHIPFDTNRSPSLIDYALTKQINFNRIPQVIYDFVSDHHPISFEISVDSEYIKLPQEARLNYTKTDWNAFRTSVVSDIRHNCMINNKKEIELNINHLYQVIKNGLANHVPKEIVKINITEIPDEALHFIKKRNQLRRKWTKNGRNNLLKMEINLITKRIYYLIKSNTEAQWVKKMDDIPPNSKDLFSPINKLTKSRRSIPPLKDNAGDYIQNDQDKAEHIAIQFAANHLQKSPTNPITDCHTFLVEEIIDVYLNGQSHDETIQQTTPLEIKNIIKKLKNKKAPGEDGISNLMLKNLPIQTIILISKIFNASLQIGYFPEQWKKSKVIALPKPGKVANLATNLRPISLLSGLSKIFERIIFTRLNTHLSNNNIIPNEQFGFRRYLSCTDALVRITEDFTHGLNMKKTTIGVALDIEKAFDSVWHKGIIYKLINCQTPHYIIKIIKSYLTNRTFTVNIGSAKSKPHLNTAGVPQGSILGPLLYILYTHDMPKNPKSKLSIYADDTFIYCTIKNTKLGTKYLQQHLKQLEKYNNNWKLNVNASKSEAISISRTKKKKVNTKISNEPLKYNNKPIEYTNNIKYLGVTFTEKLNFKKHILNRKNLANAAINKLYPALKINSGLSTINKLRLYKSYIRPIITYASPAWISSPKTTKNHLQIIQNKCLRMALNETSEPPDFKLISNAKAHEKTNMPLLFDHIHNLINSSFSRMSKSHNPLIHDLGNFSESYYNNFKFKPPHYWFSRN